MLTVIGLLCGKYIKEIYASDVSEEALGLAFANLSPYGRMTDWNKAEESPTAQLLDNFCLALNKSAVVAICRDKLQKNKIDNYKRIEKFQAGKRVIEIYKLDF